MTQASLEINKKNNIDLVLQPVKDASQILEVTIHELIEKSEFKNLYVDNGNIKNAIAELNSVLKPLQANKSGREIIYQVLERRDATITISIDSEQSLSLSLSQHMLQTPSQSPTRSATIIDINH